MSSWNETTSGGSSRDRDMRMLSRDTGAYRLSVERAMCDWCMSSSTVMENRSESNRDAEPVSDAEVYAEPADATYPTSTYTPVAYDNLDQAPQERSHPET